MVMKYITNKVRKIVRAIMEEDEIQSHICELVEANLELPDAEDVAAHIHACDIAEEFSPSDIVYEIDMSDIVYELDQQGIAETVAENFNLDYDSIAEHIDIDEVAEILPNYLDLEEIARIVDVDETIFSHINALEKKIGALTQVVIDSAQNTLDLMTLTKL